MVFRHLRVFLLAGFVAVVFCITGVGRLGAIEATSPTTITSAATTATSVSSTPVTTRTNSVATTSSAAGADSAGNSHDKAAQAVQKSAADTLPKVLLVLLLILIVAKLGGDLMERIGQPAVLGELVFGILLGNLTLLHLSSVNEFVTTVMHDPGVSVFITLLSEIGVILLLFEVGLESTIREMVSVGPSAFIVACLGVVAPMGLGFFVGLIFLPTEPWTVHLFLGAVLAATSVGITARVLKDLGRMDLTEAKIILGAAVIDDILGLVVLAVAQGAVAASDTGASMQPSTIVIIVLKAVGFFVGAIAIGKMVSPRLYKAASFLQVKGVLLSVTLGWCFLIAYLGTLVGVAPIVGAFAAGLVLEDTTVKDWHGRDSELEDLLRPLSAFLVPVFFVHTGMNVRLDTFAHLDILGFAAALTFVAILGKQVCALGVRDKSLNRQAIGIGMIPRGEVGLIVANIGRTMRTPQGHEVITADTFSAAVIMVVVTTMVTPPALKWSLDRRLRAKPKETVSK